MFGLNTKSLLIGFGLAVVLVKWGNKIPVIGGLTDSLK